MSFLQGSKEEWSLVRRHPSEGIFGMQIAGSKPQLLVPAAEIIGRECAGNLDFVDVNCGCPIDLVYKTGSGSARTFKFFRLVSSDRTILMGDVPVHSVGCRGETWKDSRRHEQGARRHSCHRQAPDGSQGWQEHGA